MDEFNEANSNVVFDFEKRVFLDELEIFVRHISTAFTNGDYNTFEEKMNNIAYLSLVKEEY